jgi:hypothetical protein
MESFIEDLREQLSAQLETVDAENGPVKGYAVMTELVEQSIVEMKYYLLHHPFPDIATEVKYFKEWAPSFFKQQIYFAELYNLELIRITAMDNKVILSYLKKTKKHIEKFLKKYQDLHLYFRMDRQDKDEELFVRRSPSKREAFLIADATYCENCILLSKIKAYEDLLPLLTSSMDKKAAPPYRRRYEWHPNKSQTAELIYTFAKKKCISVDGKMADIKDIADIYKDVFNVDLGNIYDIHLHNKHRKKDKAPYIRSMLDSYLSDD